MSSSRSSISRTSDSFSTIVTIESTFALIPAATIVPADTTSPSSTFKSFIDSSV